MNTKHLTVVACVLLTLVFFFNFFRVTGFAVYNPQLLVTVDIPSDQERINPGQSLLLETVLREPGGTVDQTEVVDLQYSIKDMNGNIISLKKESGEIALKESTITSLLIPSNTKPGTYLATVDVNYQGENYTATKSFEISGNNNLRNAIYVISGLAAFVIIFFIIRKRRYT